MITVSTNVKDIKFLHRLNSTTNAISKACERMSSGYKINQASDNAAGLVISKSLQTQTNGLTVANQNAQSATNVLSVADSALSQVYDSTLKIRDLALQAANGGYSELERQTMQEEINQIQADIKQTITGANFNEYKVFGSQEITDDGSIKVSTAKELFDALNSTEALNNKDFKITLTSDIDLNDLGDVDGSGSNWVAIGSNAAQFMGSIDGGGHVIKNLTIAKSGMHRAFIGYADGATIKNITIENVEINGGSRAGMLAGEIKRTKIENCSTSGKVTGGEYTGGLVGIIADNLSSVVNCSTSGTVIASSCVGGIAGSNHGKISNSFSCASLNGKDATSSSVSGFIGVNYGTVENCFYSGQILINKDTPAFAKANSGSQINNCYYVEQDIALHNTAPATMQSADWFKDTNNLKSILGDDYWVFTPSGVEPPKPKDERLHFQIGTMGDSLSEIIVDTRFKYEELGITIATQDDALAAIDKCDALIEQINTKRGEIGASMNIMDSVVQNNTITHNNLMASNSTIRDADIARESANMVKSQILQNSAASLLSLNRNQSQNILMNFYNAI